MVSKSQGSLPVLIVGLGAIERAILQYQVIHETSVKHLFQILTGLHSRQEVLSLVMRVMVIVIGHYPSHSVYFADDLAKFLRKSTFQGDF